MGYRFRVSNRDLEIISVCEVRYQVNKSCKSCMYYGKECENLKHYFKVRRPSEVDDNIIERRGH